MSTLVRMAHLVWDWNGTLLDDLSLVVSATNAALATAGAGPITPDHHRRHFRRPVSDYYADVLRRPLSPNEFARLDRTFHDTYRRGFATCLMTSDALAAMAAWRGTQSLLSMWFHAELVPAIDRYGLTSSFLRVDGNRSTLGGDRKAEHLATHLDELALTGPSVVLIGDSVDDAEAAAYVGARCVLYSGGFTDVERLCAAGVPVADTLLAAVTLAAEIGEDS